MQINRQELHRPQNTLQTNVAVFKRSFGDDGFCLNGQIQLLYPVHHRIYQGQIQQARKIKIVQQMFYTKKIK